MLRGLIHGASSSAVAALPRQRLLASSRRLGCGGEPVHASYPIRSFFFSGKGDDGDSNNGKGGGGKKGDDEGGDKSKKSGAEPTGADDAKPNAKSSKVTKTFLGGTSSSSPSSSDASDTGGSSGNGARIGVTPPTKLGFGEEAPRYPHLLALPIVSKPFFPGVVSTVTLTDPRTITAIENLSKEGTRYVGCFLRKDAPSGVTANGLIVDTPELIKDPSELYSTGTFAQIMAINQGPGIGPEHMHAHPTRQDWDRMGSGGNGETDHHHDDMGGLGQVHHHEADERFHDDDDQPRSATVLLSTHRRIDLLSVDNVGPPIDVTVSHWDRMVYNPTADTQIDDKIRALTNEVLSSIREVAQLNPLFRDHLRFFPNRVDASDPFRLADFVATVSTGTPEELQAILEEKDAEMRLHKALVLITKEKEVSKLQQEISAKVEEKMTDTQRKYFLNEQLKSIKKELGMEKDDKEALIQKYRKQLKKYPAIPEEANDVIESELEKLSTLEKNSTEFNVTRNYLDWLTAIPWGLVSDDTFDIDAARNVLDRDHYGMDDVKDIILQFIAVGKLKGKIQGKILCLAGPPGVGKTSIASSIADALGRKFFRFSVGGLSDVSEIKGHRRTYVGAMPGKMIQCLKSTGSMNPLILIDEIDKLGRDFRGDPASALLEVLDPNQNGSFSDHFLDVPIDMSQVLFMCTANDLSTIPGPLLDRMEIVSLSGYDMPEKIAIAEQYLIPKAMKESGLLVEKVKEEVAKAVAEEEKEGKESSTDEADKTPEVTPEEEEEEKQFVRGDGVPDSLAIDTTALESLVRWYCREAGVRNLEKHINKITRKLALQVVAEKEGTDLTEKSKRKSDSWNVTEKNLDDYVGKPLFTSDRMYEKDPLPNGIVMGLAWTSMGGSALYIETQSIIRGKDADGKQRGGGTLKVTGQLGDVMAESTQIAYTVARARLAEKQSDNTYFDDFDVHMHVPEGATPKDGPSAGITMVTAMLSLALDRPVRNDLAMTGEISLTGKVLPVGGIKEKTMAARRAGIKCIVFPAENKRDFDELPDYLKEGLDVTFASDYADVFGVAFGS
jgi:Lon-like ATP-dependent protease